MGVSFVKSFAKMAKMASRNRSAASRGAAGWFRQQRPVLRHIEFARIFAGNCFAKTARCGSAPLWRGHRPALGVRSSDAMQSGAPTPAPFATEYALHVVLTGIFQMGRSAKMSSPIAFVPTLHWGTVGETASPHCSVSCYRPIV